jgi:hypothetical protein
MQFRVQEGANKKIMKEEQKNEYKEKRDKENMYEKRKNMSL